MSDRHAQQLLSGLSRAVAEPAGLPLLATRSSPGLFAATAVGRQAAKLCQDEGLVSARPEQTDQPLYGLTEKGFQHLVDQAPPKQLVEDFLRVLEARQSQTTELLQTVTRMHASLDAMRSALLALREPRSPTTADEMLLDSLRRWQGSGDCPLPELHGLTTSLTIGQFHDALRRLHETGRVYLHPWTGPLHDLPQPKFALLIGHQIAYYASVRG
jgi:hypothetical protein